MPQSPERRRPWSRHWPWFFAAAVVLAFLAAAVAGGFVLIDAIRSGSGSGGGWDVVIDGERFWPQDFGVVHVGLAACGVVLALLIVMVVVPLALLAALGGVALAVVFGVGLPLVLVVVLAAVLLSPLWILAWLAWLALRKPRPAAA